MTNEIKRVGFDIDGVLFPLDNLVINMVGRPNSLSSWEFYKEWGWTKSDFTNFYYDAIENHDLFSRAPIHPLANKTIALLKQMGYYIVLCTIRGEHAAPRVQDAARQQTITWLQNNKVDYDELIFSDDKNSANSICFFDDNVQNYEALERKGRSIPFIFTQPFNESYHGRRVNSFRSIPGAVLWSTQHRRDQGYSGRGRRGQELLVKV